MVTDETGRKRFLEEFKTIETNNVSMKLVIILMAQDFEWMHLKSIGKYDIIKLTSRKAGL